MTTTASDLFTASTCEDYPCCGHTNDDPCAPQAYDAPGYYDTTVRGNEHALCEHSEGFCDVEEFECDDEDCAVTGVCIC